MERILKTLAPIALALTLAGCLPHRPPPPPVDTQAEQQRAHEEKARADAEATRQQAEWDKIEKASTFVSLADAVAIGRAKKYNCIYVAVNNTPVYVDAEGKVRLEKVSSGEIYAKLTDGPATSKFVRAIQEEMGEDMDPEKQYRVVYLPPSLVALDYHETDLFKSDKDDESYSSDSWVSKVERLCSVPPAIELEVTGTKSKQKASPPIADKGTRVVQKEDNKKK